jgi:hypothetical protein
MLSSVPVTFLQLTYFVPAEWTVMQYVGRH